MPNDPENIARIAHPVINYTTHAKDRMLDRGITASEVVQTLLFPLRTQSADKGRRESQSLILRNGKQMLLRVRTEGNIEMLVITVMVTTKFEKYGVVR